MIEKKVACNGAKPEIWIIGEAGRNRENSSQEKKNEMKESTWRRESRNI